MGGEGVVSFEVGERWLERAAVSWDLQRTCLDYT